MKPLARLFGKLRRVVERLGAASAVDTLSQLSAPPKLGIWVTEDDVAIAFSAVDAAQLMRDAAGCDGCDVMCMVKADRCYGSQGTDWRSWSDDKIFEMGEEIDVKDDAVHIHNAVSGTVSVSQTLHHRSDGSSYLIRRTKASPSWWCRERGRGLLASTLD